MEVFSLPKPAPARIDDDIPFQQSLSNDPEFGQHGLVSILAVFQHVLNRYEIVPGNDPFMLVVIMTDRPFAAVLDGLMGQHILGEGLSGIHIATVPFIAHRSRNT